MNDDSLKEIAVNYAKKHKKEIAIKETSIELYKSEKDPTSVFMAGSPGAGKTESSKWLLKKLSGGDDVQKVLRIDTDDLRLYFDSCGYDGRNSHIFQYPASILVSKIHDLALSNSQSFIFDGTFANLDRARENIQRSLNKNRMVQILYVYQDPVQAWEFVKQREEKEGRRIRKDDFIQKYFNSRFVVNSMKQEFGSDIQIDILHKNNDFTHKLYERNVESIDIYIPETYTNDTLIKMLL